MLSSRPLVHGLVLTSLLPTLLPATSQAATVLTTRSLAVALGGDFGAAGTSALRLLAQESECRTGTAIVTPDSKSAKLRLRIEKSPLSNGSDRSAPSNSPSAPAPAVGSHATPSGGFVLSTRPDPDGYIRLVAADASGLIAGVGRLLRLARYESGQMHLPETEFVETPRLPIRGMFIATHFHNFYHNAPFEEVDRLIEDLALWGCNSLAVCFDMDHFQRLDDPDAQRHLARLKHFAETACSLGMEFGLGMTSNEGYASSPKDLRISFMFSANGTEICPSKPGGLELIGKWQSELYAALPHLDFIWGWPHDTGGCSCERCRPWAGNGYVRAAENQARLFHQRHPKGKVWLSTWLFGMKLSGKEFFPTDYDDFFGYIRDRKPEWFDGILFWDQLSGDRGQTDEIGGLVNEERGREKGSPSQGASRAAVFRAFTRPRPERYALARFPEISMWCMAPWGGWGATALPGFLEDYFAAVDGRIVGGWAYSEGAYEDLNKFLWIRWACNPDQPIEEMLKEYAAYYFGADSAVDGAKLFRLLEKTHPRKGWQISDLHDAGAAWEIARAIDGRTQNWARQSWRWRLFHNRAKIDDVVRRQGWVSPDARRELKPLFAEIRALYHVDEKTHSVLRPALNALK